MQEKFKKIKNTAKKLAAVGTGVLVAGMSLTGAALAADLSGLPAPIVSSGAFDAYVVVGTSATTITAETLKDVAGAIELSTAFGQLATTTTGAEGQATLQVEQFTGTTLTAMYLDGDASADPTFHEDVSWSGLGASSDLTALDDVPYTLSDGTAINATIGLTFDDDYVEVARSNIGVHINSSTDTVNVVQVNMSSNRTGTYTFAEGDKLNWFGTLYEIVDVKTDSNVTLGTTSSVTANVGEAFTIGGQTFTLLDIFSTSSVYVQPATGDAVTVNNTYSTIGSIQLRVTEAQKGDVYKFAKFETVENSDTFAVGDLWPLAEGADEFVVDAMTINTTGAVIESGIILRNNKTYDLSAKGSKTSIVEGLDFIYSDNTQDETAADSLAETGGTGVVWINETSGVTQTIYANYTYNGDGTYNETSLSLPGALFYNYTVDDVRSDALTSLTTGDYGDKYNRLYVYDVNSGRYELAVKPLSTGNMTYIIPYNSAANANYTTNAQGGEWVTTVTAANTNHTTPSGIKVGLLEDLSLGFDGTLYVQLKVAAVEISIDGEAAVYGRKDVGWSSLKYSDYGASVNWGSNVVTVHEPAGQDLTVAITFSSTTDDAYFNSKADIDLGGADITATGNTTGTQQSTTHGSNIGFWSTNGATGMTINGTYIDQVIGITMPRKDISIGVGALQNVTTTLDTNADDSTYPGSSVFGNTTVYLMSGAGESASVNKITPGIAKLDTEITTGTLAKPVVLLGGPAINGLVKTLVDNGLLDITDLLAQGVGHAQIDLIENAFNSQSALAVMGYSGDDTLMAAKAVAGSLLNSQPFSFATHNVTTLLLNTGVSAVGDVSVVS